MSYFSRRAFLGTSATVIAGTFLTGKTRAGHTESRDWQVGLSRICITPDEPVWLHGYAGQPRFQPFEGKLNDLYAKAMAIEYANGDRAVLVALDLCVLRRREAKAVFDRLTTRTGLTRKQILLNFSHTHSGPILGTSDLDRYPMSPEERRATVDYTEKLVGLLEDVVLAAIADVKPARLSWGVGRCEFVRNRRTYNPDGSYRGMGPNPDKYADDTVPVLRIDAPDDKLRALVFGCACHTVTLDANNLKLSGDFASFAQEHIEAEYPGVQATFIQGCGADANPHPRGGSEQWKRVRQQGEDLGREVCRIAEEALQPISGALRVEFATPALPLQPVPPRDVLEGMTGAMRHNASRMLAALDRNEQLPTHRPHPLAVWQFGNDLTWVAIAGEVVSAYVPLIEEAIGPDRLWIAGYSNEVDGYVPDATIVAEGGYEARGLVADIGFYSRGAQDVLLAAVRELAIKAGRNVP